MLISEGTIEQYVFNSRVMAILQYLNEVSLISKKEREREPFNICNEYVELKTFKHAFRSGKEGIVYVIFL